VETYNTEEEQVEALKRWWQENGRSTVIAIVVALSASFGWQAWNGYQDSNMEQASNIYQQMLQVVGTAEMTEQQVAETNALALQLKSDHPDSSYAQFAALQLARLAVANDELTEAEVQLRWVLMRAESGGDIAQVAELRLARVLAAQGQLDAALQILQQATGTSYGASYAVARGDILLQQGHTDEARSAYQDAQILAAQGAGQVNLETVEQKLQSLSPVPARTIEAAVDGEVEPAVVEEQ
jgi:predicted negative regulator of RcsB-dependent stress response